MSFKVDLTAPGIDRLINVFKLFPELAEKHYRPAVTRDVNLLRSMIQPNIPSRTGRSASTFGAKVTGKSFNMKGQVGWYDKSDPWYINIVEHGAVAHEITVRPREDSGVLGWGEGNFSKGHTISHPGFDMRGFMAAGYEALEPIIENDLAVANERILAEFAAI